MNIINSKQLLGQLNWRYATKQFDPNRKISDQDWSTIDCENCRVRPDAERECEHGHGGEAGVLEQLAESEFQIVHGSLSVVSRP